FIDGFADESAEGFGTPGLHFFLREAQDVNGYGQSHLGFRHTFILPPSLLASTSTEGDHPLLSARLRVRFIPPFALPVSPLVGSRVGALPRSPASLQVSFLAFRSAVPPRSHLISARARAAMYSDSRRKSRGNP